MPDKSEHGLKCGMFQKNNNNKIEHSKAPTNVSQNSHKRLKYIPIIGRCWRPESSNLKGFVRVVIFEVDQFSAF
jgi:hypothetical protein